MSSYWKKAEGIATVSGPYGDVQEIKTTTCAHCNAIVYVQPGTDGTAPLSPVYGEKKREPPAVCHLCWALVCPRCHATGECRPFEKVLLEIEAKSEFRKSAGLE